MCIREKLLFHNVKCPPLISNVARCQFMDTADSWAAECFESYWFQIIILNCELESSHFLRVISSLRVISYGYINIWEFLHCFKNYLCTFSFLTNAMTLKETLLVKVFFETNEISDFYIVLAYWKYSLVCSLERVHHFILIYHGHVAFVFVHLLKLPEAQMFHS